MSNPTTDDFKYFFNTKTWIDNVPAMIERFNYVTKKYPELIKFAEFFNKTYYNATANAFNDPSTRDEVPIKNAAGQYYANKNISTARFFSSRQIDYQDNYYYCYVLTKTIEYLYTYKDSDYVVNRYIYYAKIDKKSIKQVDKAYNDLQKMFKPLPEARIRAPSPSSSRRIRTNVGIEPQGEETDIFFSLHPENRIRSSSIDRKNIKYSSIDVCNPDCDDQSDKGCCKKVMDAFNTIARNFTPKQKTVKLKKEGGKTRNKNKKHYSRRCKNRKNKKSCKKPHK
jgi:hypothetical protein